MLEFGKEQHAAVNKLNNGSILCGGTGSGKSRTAIMYYYTKVCGGSVKTPLVNTQRKMKTPKDLYIITTAKKRNDKEWLDELQPFDVKNIKVVVDSWNNIKKYIQIKDAFFIFDEQRVIGYGAWTKAFLKITAKNQWILLSATPGDTWTDYMPVFIANGFYKNKTQFIQRHVVYSRFTKYPKVDRYLEADRLMALRRQILVNIEYAKKTKPHYITDVVAYDKEQYRFVYKEKWDIFKDEPCQGAAQVGYTLRRIINSDQERVDKAKEYIKNIPRLIIFYNFNYERDLLLEAAEQVGKKAFENNGRKHDPVPNDDEWVYLVNYMAGAEGWNCIKTNHILFYSYSYSYRIMHQAAGRTDRRNTPYEDLYYYYLRSNSPLDLAIRQTLRHKKDFNISAFV